MQVTPTGSCVQQIGEECVEVALRLIAHPELGHSCRSVYNASCTYSKPRGVRER
jgi:hypothetical protein